MVSGLTKAFSTGKVNIDLVIEDITAKIQAAVEDGRLTQAEADKKIKKIQGKWGK